MSTTLEQKLNLILNEKETKILPENIKKDVQIFDIVGTLENSGIDTSDATAKASDIISTKTAYVNGEKITGTLNNNGSMTYNAGDNVVNIDDGVHTKSKINPVDITTLAKYHNYYNTNVHILRDMSIPYTKIEYLQSTGKQLIDTGIQIRKNITFEICTQLTNPNNDEYMFGGGDGWLRNCIAPRNIDSGGFNMYPYIGTENYDCYNQSNIGGKHTYRYEKGLFKSDGVTRINRTSIADFTSKNNFGIFGAIAFGRGRIKFYYCKIWDEDMNLVRDFIPVKDNNGVGCLYDLVTEKFYYDTINQEQFIVGADILDMSVDDQLEIISSERDKKILPENIKKDISILGVTGTLESGGSTDYNTKIENYTGGKILSALIKIPMMDTSNVTNMQQAFDGCSSITEIPLLDTSKVTNMSFMFNACSKLTNVPALDTSSATSMSQMFAGCVSLVTIPSLNTGKVDSMQSMFDGCSKLTNIPLLNTSKVTITNHMFKNCSAIIEIPPINTESVTQMYNMFNGCTNLVTIPVLNTRKVTSMKTMFTNCSSLSDESLNNVLTMCINATKITSNKTLKYIGLTSEQATKCTTLSNYSAFTAAGWTTGY